MVMVQNCGILFLSNFMFLLQNSGIGEPSVYHALIVIFLEFFAWGLLTMPVISVSTLSFNEYFFYNFSNVPIYSRF